MLPAELLRKTRLIEITTRKMVDDFMSGRYRSHFKGHGVQFSEHRPYVAGDDIRHIDWKVSARTRDPLVKKYEEERELTVFLVIDVSASGRFGSSGKLKSDISAEIAGMLAYAAIHTGDKVGALLFSGGIDRIVPPKKGRQHTLRIIREILKHEPCSPGTDLTAALEATGRIMKHSGVVFVISDFLAKDYSVHLKKLARRHDVVALSVRDDREFQVPGIGHLMLLDPETGEERLVDTTSYSFRNWLEQVATEHRNATKSAFKGGKIEHLELLTKDDYAETVVRYFRMRSRRKSR